MKPLNYAILKYMTTVDEACAEDVMTALRETYGRFKAFTEYDIMIALMTAEVNGLVEEARFSADDKGKIRIYYRAHAEGAATINRYIRD
jgi:DNA-binding PadR family transcriptional regulator